MFRRGRFEIEIGKVMWIELCEFVDVWFLGFICDGFLVLWF